MAGRFVAFGRVSGNGLGVRVSSAEAISGTSVISPFQAFLEMPEAAFEALPVATVLCDGNHFLVRYNSRAAQLWGRSPKPNDPSEQYCGFAGAFTMEGAVLRPADMPSLKALRRGRPLTGQKLAMVTGDGSRRAVALNIAPLQNSAGRTEGVLVQMTDATAEAQELARRSRAEADAARRRAEADAARRMEEQQALYNFTNCLQRTASLPDVFEAALDAISGALRCDRAAILLYDDAGVMRFAAWRDLSDGYRSAVEGHSPWKPETTDAEPIVVPDVADSNEPDWLKSTLSSEGIQALMFIPVLARGRLIGKFMAYYDAAREFPSSAVALASTIGRQIGFAIERRRAEEERSAAEVGLRRLAAIVESSDDAIISKDLNGVIVSWNNSAQRIFGYTADEVIGKPVTILMPPERVNEEPGILARIRRGERVDHYETVRRRKDGKLLNISLTVSPIKDASGQIVGASKIARDVTEKKRMEEQRDLMVAELSHRVKNTLATVISIARQSFTGPEMAKALRAFDARICALAQTHSRLAEASWSGVPLHTLLSDELAPYRRDGSESFRLSGPPVSLKARAAVSLGMAMHELATNAAKYGAFSSGSGLVDVSWADQQPDNLFCLQWRESGGPPVTPPSRRGFGRLLLERALGSDLGGHVKMEFLEPGLNCSISMPLDQTVASVP